MSARLLKKVLKEQEAALQQQQQLNADDESESPDSPPPFRNPFDLLEDEIDDGDNDHNRSDQEKGNIAGETSDIDIRKHSSNGKVSVSTATLQNAKSKKKKKKTREELFWSTEKDESSSDLMLETLTLGASSSNSQPIISQPLKSMFKKQWKSSVLQVDPKFLSADGEMRRIFGSKVVNSYEKSQLPTNSRQMRGGRRGNLNLKKTILVSPSEHWPRWDGSLSMELLETKDGIHYFRYTHSSSYAHVQRAFEAAKAIHDLNGIASILVHYPYHIDSLITLADYFKFTGEHQMSADSTAKCLYAMECAWHPLFSQFQNSQLKYVHDTNKPFFTSLFTHMRNMDRRGCHRAALEICKLLLSLDSDDPKGAKLCIDYYSLRADEYAWLEQFAEEYVCDNSLWMFPNFSYSLAICRFYLENNEQSKDTETGNGKATSSDLMKQALMLHPSVLSKLSVKVPLKERMWNNIIKHSFFKSEQSGSASLDHLISIYVERSYIIWRLPDLQKLLYDSAVLVINVLEKQPSDTRDWACVRKEVFSCEKNEYSHLLISDFSDSIPTMPPDNLQDFIADPRGGGAVEVGGEVPNIREARNIREVSNRSAFAVLLESILPWVHYGTRDGHDIPEQAHND